MLMTNYTAKLLNLEDVIITGVDNISDQLHIYVELPRRAHICQPVVPLLTGSTTTVCRRSRMFLSPEILSCTFGNAVIAVPAANGSLRRIPFFPVTAELPADLLLRLCSLSRSSFPQRKSAAASMCLPLPPCAILTYSIRN